MPQRLIAALIDKGWSYSVIALRSKIAEDRLRSCNLGRRETQRLEELICRDTRLDLDVIYGEEVEE